MIAAAIGNTVFWLGHLSDYDWGVEAYDRLSIGQKLTALCTVGEGLLLPGVAPFELTQWMDATVATLFEVLRAEVVPEIDEIDEPEQPELRFVPLVEAYAIDAGYTCPDRLKVQIPEWECLLECMAEEILFDLDYEDEDIYIDGPPEMTAALLKRMTIAPNYFADVVDDPPEAMHATLIDRLHKLTADVWPS